MNLTCVTSGSLNGNCYLLQSDDGRYIILDCGGKYEWIRRACNSNVMQIDFALCTHIHKDHSAAVPQLLFHGIDVYSNKEVADMYPGVGVLGDKHTDHLYGWKVTPFKVPHTNADSSECMTYAYIIEKDGYKVLYMTDWMYCRYNLSKLNIDTFLIAVNYTDLEEDEEEKNRHVLQGHSSLETAMDFIRTSATDNCKNIIACHLSNRNADSKKVIKGLTEAAPENTKIIIAEKGTYRL